MSIDRLEDQNPVTKEITSILNKEKRNKEDFLIQSTLNSESLDIQSYKMWRLSDLEKTIKQLKTNSIKELKETELAGIELTKLSIAGSAGITMSLMMPMLIAGTIVLALIVGAIIGFAAINPIGQIAAAVAVGAAIMLLPNGFITFGLIYNPYLRPLFAFFAASLPIVSLAVGAAVLGISISPQIFIALAVVSSLACLLLFVIMLVSSVLEYHNVTSLQQDIAAAKALIATHLPALELEATQLRKELPLELESVDFTQTNLPNGCSSASSGGEFNRARPGRRVFERLSTSPGMFSTARRAEILTDLERELNDQPQNERLPGQTNRASRGFFSDNNNNPDGLGKVDGVDFEPEGYNSEESRSSSSSISSDGSI